MEREKVVLSQAEIDRQKEYMAKLRRHHEERGKTVRAMVDTFGCQQNVADGERLMGMLREMGCELTRDAKDADIIVLNTCAIRDHAEKRVFGNLGALTHTKKANPQQIICLCGCMAQRPAVAQKVKESYRHVDLVFGPQAAWKFPELLYNVYASHKRIFSIEEEHGTIAEGLPVVREDRIRAWVSIMYGCNNFCSYCIVPYVRGRERSRDMQEIVSEVQELVNEGYKEITLLGQNVNSYGKDLPEKKDFADLLSEIDQIEGDYLIRFMSSQPKDATEKLFDTMARCTHVAHQLHLPVQSGNDRVLRAMNRPYTRESYLALIRYARKAMPDLVLTSDVIVGFPGETYEELKDTISLIEEAEFDALFTFIFSPRPGTPAANMADPVTREEKQVWFDELCAAQNAISQKTHAEYVGKTYRVLIDGKTDDVRWPLSSRTNGGRLIHLNGDESLIGTYQTVKVTDSNTWALYGEVEG